VTSFNERRAHAREIFAAGVRSADPFEAVKRHVEITDGILRADGRNYDLAAIANIFVIGCGKAAARMALALQEIIGARITGGVVVVKYGHGVLLEKIKVVEAGHPIPDRAGFDGARQVIDLVSRAGVADLILFVISGGGSALLPMPAEGLTLEDKQQTTQTLLASGATIQEVNALRKHLSRLKGGRLAELAYPASTVALVLSDVVGDRLDAIASGPTVGDATTFEDCLEIVRRYDLGGKIPVKVLDLLERGARGGAAETPKPSAAPFQKVQNIIVGSNRTALAAAQQRAASLGYQTQVLTSSIEGESRIVASSHCARIKEMLRRDQLPRQPVCLISGGETTVTLRGDGLGGRNQEFAVAAAIEIAELDNVVVLSAGTDGTDGPTDAAGAIVDGTTVERGRAQGLNPHEFLARNDSYHFLQATGDLLITGPTLTNVMDLQVILVG
jgi:hydroxypyruvate reductase